MTLRSPAPRPLGQMGCELRKSHRGPGAPALAQPPHSLTAQDSQAEAEICSRRPPGGVTKRGLAF